MTAIFVPDVSEFQVPVDDSYNRDWFIFRACFGDHKYDEHVAHNLAWAINARKTGKINGFTVYVVYLPGDNAGILSRLDALGVPTDCIVMIDAETWRGQSYEISGNHSGELNDLANKLRARQQGNAKLVWGYGNQGDLAEVWPSRPDWLDIIVAGYGFKLSPDTVPNQIGQQYTDGLSKFDITGWPSSTPPFGRCDHNIIYTLPGETDVPLTTDDITKVADASANTLLDKRFVNVGASATQTSIRDLLHQSRDLAAAAKAQTDTLEASIVAVKAELDAVKAELEALAAAPATSVTGPVHVTLTGAGDLTVS